MRQKQEGFVPLASAKQKLKSVVNATTPVRAINNRIPTQK
jgi:hypothetical protein